MAVRFTRVIRVTAYEGITVRFTRVVRVTAYEGIFVRFTRVLRVVAYNDTTIAPIVVRSLIWD